MIVKVKVKVKPKKLLDLAIWLIICKILLNLARNIYILIPIDPYFLKLSNIVQYYRILWNIVQYCRQILSGIARYCSSQYFSPLLYELWCCKDIVRYIQISPDIVRHWLILSCIDQYCPLASYVDIFPLQL